MNMDMYMYMSKQNILILPSLMDIYIVFQKSYESISLTNFRTKTKQFTTSPDRDAK